MSAPHPIHFSHRATNIQFMLGIFHSIKSDSGPIQRNSSLRTLPLSVVRQNETKVILPRSGPDNFWKLIQKHYAGADQRKWKYLVPQTADSPNTNKRLHDELNYLTKHPADLLEEG